MPNGNVGKRFVNLLANEIEQNVNGIHNSERIFLFTAFILQRKKSVQTGKEIRSLISKRLDLWENNKIKILLNEAKKCDAQFQKRNGQMSWDDTFRIFNRMMLQGNSSSNKVLNAEM